MNPSHNSRYKTPLRYPGGKQKLAQFIIEIIEESNLVGGDYIEPYAGGAGVAMELLLTDKVDRVHLNDSSIAIFAFWRSILDHTSEFCKKITGAKLNVAEWRRQRSILLKSDARADLDLGFSLFYLNRCNRSGIPTGGVIGGLKQEGEWLMSARFPKEELVERIERIAKLRSRIRIRNWDAEKFIVDYIPSLPPNALVYCDPPYFKQGHRLYLSRYKPEDHARIAKTIQEQIARPWIVSYDAAPEILQLYSERRLFVYDLQYNAQRVHKGKEVFVFSDTVEIPGSSKVKAISAVIQAGQGKGGSPIIVR